MKKLYGNILIFLIPVFIVWLGVELFYRCTDTAYTEKNKQLRTEYSDAEVLVLGNSHALYGIDPEYFDSRTYNVANISQTLYFDELILNTYLDSLPQLETVIITISYFSLSQKDNTMGDVWRKYFYKHQMNLDVPLVSRWDIKNYSLALTRRFDASVEFVKVYLEEGTIARIKPNGYGLQDERDIVPDKEAIVPIILKRHEDGSSDFTQNTERLHTMINTCKQRGINVLMVEMPMYKTYWEALRKDKKDTIEGILQKLEREYKNTFYLKLSQDPRFEEKDLRDLDHLTNEGAAKASRIINNYIEEKMK